MDSSSQSHADSGVVDTLQSLIVAFVLAMTFRGFVAEGFIIPTGSMAPTLMGQHALLHSSVTGYSFPAGFDPHSRPDVHNALDPMLGRNYRVGTPRVRPMTSRVRTGDRILVLKGLYAFASPKRFDVVVFKNPTDPKGDAGNYIKRLIGLPNEVVWLADGDVFVKKDGEQSFQVQRKPDHVQRALWQPIHHSDYAVMFPNRLDQAYTGPPWRGQNWNLQGRAYRFDSADPTVLEWDNAEMRLDDWAMYNMLGQRTISTVPISDLRVAAGVVADTAGLEIGLELHARSHIFEFSIADGQAIARYRSAHAPETQWIAEASESVRAFKPGNVHNIEFWHVDQSLRIFVNGSEAVRLDYNWSPQQRIEYATGMNDQQRSLIALAGGGISETQLRWRFEGSPVTLHRVQVDRDLYYRSATLESNQLNKPTHRGPAFGTHPDNLAVLGPDHFFMLGDNSQASLDSRLWGSPHSLVAEQIDDSPFVVHRDLLLGKAWVVYFPAMYPLKPDGAPIIPDFGRLRYIR